MTQEECEIEYLDEDEEVVQHCMQIVQTTPALANVKIENNSPLLLERNNTSKSKRKMKSEPEDSDYDPTDDLLELQKKKVVKKQPKKVIKMDSELASKYVRKTANSNVSQRNQQTKLQIVQRKSTSKPLVIKEVRPGPLKQKNQGTDLVTRRKLDIKIPDFDDPLCLPVRAVIREEIDKKKLKNWNELCLEHIKKGDSSLKTHGTTTASKKTIILSNARSKCGGKVETSVSGKTYVESDVGDIKVETYKCILPRFREKNTTKQYNLYRSLPRSTKHTFEVLLTKEVQKDEEYLVVYKPGDAVSAVYKNDAKTDDSIEGERKKISIKEATCCKICAPCYQASWRGGHTEGRNGSVKCAVCSRNYVSVYNLLAHLKTHHESKDVRRYQIQLSTELAKMVEYHYKCRICMERFLTIKSLRKHVFRHKGTEVFRCEVGNHMAS